MDGKQRVSVRVGVAVAILAVIAVSVYCFIYLGHQEPPAPDEEPSSPTPQAPATEGKSAPPPPVPAASAGGNLQGLQRYAPFFHDKNEDLADVVPGWLQAHAGDPLFDKAVARVDDVLAPARLVHHARAYYDEGCIVFHEKGVGRLKERDMALVNLASMQFARAQFDQLEARLPRKLAGGDEPLVMIALKDVHSFHRFHDLKRDPWILKMRSYYSRPDRWIVTYNPLLQSGPYFTVKIHRMTAEAIHEAFNHTVAIHCDGRTPLRASYQFEKGLAEYVAGVKTVFSRGAGAAPRRHQIEHTGLHTRRLKDYAGRGGARDSTQFPRLGLAELIGLHAIEDCTRLATARAAASRVRVDPEMIDAVVGLAHDQGYSFVYFCLEAGADKYENEFIAWLGWQWSRAAVDADHHAAWATFQGCFSDVVTLEKEWQEWEDGLPR